MKNAKLNLVFGLLSICSTLSFGAQPGDKRARPAADQELATNSGSGATNPLSLQEQAKLLMSNSQPMVLGSVAPVSVQTVVVPSLKWANGASVKWADGTLVDLKRMLDVYGKKPINFNVTLELIKTMPQSGLSAEKALTSYNAIVFVQAFRVLEEICCKNKGLQSYCAMIKYNLITSQNFEQRLLPASFALRVTQHKVESDDVAHSGLHALASSAAAASSAPALSAVAGDAPSSAAVVPVAKKPLTLQEQRQLLVSRLNAAGQPHAASNILRRNDPALSAVGEPKADANKK